MKRFVKILKNKYVYSTLFVVVYILFLHESDIVTLTRRNERISEFEREIERKKTGIEELKIRLSELEDIRSLEKFAREEHFFKKQDEDLFIFSFE